MDNNSQGGIQDYQVLDNENYRGNENNVFNHQGLVMEALRKCNESGGHEMRNGWFNEKMDANGNLTRTYIEDTQKKFIGCVKTAMSVMSCDGDNMAVNNVDKILEDLGKEKENLLEDQWKWYNGLEPREKEIYKGKIYEIFFNTELGWYQKYVELEEEAYRDIFSELHQLTDRKDFYEGDEYTA